VDFAGHMGEEIVVVLMDVIKDPIRSMIICAKSTIFLIIVKKTQKRRRRRRTLI
jgi:hypothetical protein